MALVPEKHVFVCTGGDCRKSGGKKVCKAFRDALRECGGRRSARVIEVDCLEQCGQGPMALVYPDGYWYAGLSEKDARDVALCHLTEGRPVRSKLYKKAHPQKPLLEEAA